MGLLKQMNDFNSIKVQLKRMSLLQSQTLLLFQFHKGTIKTFRFY